MAREKIPRLDWQATCLSTRLLDATTLGPDVLDTEPMMHVHSTRGRPSLPSAAPLLGGSALRAARVKASSACKTSSNEQK